MFYEWRGGKLENPWKNWLHIVLNKIYKYLVQYVNLNFIMYANNGTT